MALVVLQAAYEVAGVAIPSSCDFLWPWRCQLNFAWAVFAWADVI